MVKKKTILQDDKNVLVIMLTPIDGLSSTILRALALVKGLVVNGYSVEILTTKRNDATVINNVDQYEFLNHVKITYANSNSVYNSIISVKGNSKLRAMNVLRNIYHALSPFDHTMSIARNVNISSLKTRKCKYIISVSDPKSVHVAAKRLIKQGLIYEKWIQYWGDPLATDITKTGIYPKFVYKELERRLFNKSDLIFYTSPFTLREQKQSFRIYSDRMRYIPTAYIEEKVYPEHEGGFTIGYYGAYYSSVRNIKPLYDACLEDDQIQLNIVGDSDLQLKKAQNIEIYPRGDISKFERETDLYVCVLNSSGNQIPGKLYHYAGTNKPILVLLDGDNMKEFQSFFERYKRYIFCKNNKDDIRKMISHIRASKQEYAPCKKMSCEYIVKVMLEEK